MISRLKSSHLTAVFIAMGFSAMISQIVLLRELVLFFTGNELTLGIILAAWLLWTAVGSGQIGKLVKNFSNPYALMIISEFLLAALLPITVIFIRSSRSIFAIPAGEITSPLFILIVPLFALAPVCIIVGFLYTLGCKLLSQTSQETDSSVPGQVFLFESIGAGVAGFVASVILFRFLENFEVVTILCAINWIVAIFIWTIPNKKLMKYLILLAVLFALVLIILFPKLDRISTKRIWGFLDLLHSETTIYGNIAVTGLEESVSFYENGVLMFTHPDLMYAEESVHFALLEHPNPQRVLVIGGDAAGSLSQILYHPNIKLIDFVLIDPKSIELAQKFIPALNEILKDQRIKIWYRDGRLFLKGSKTKYDVIIINLPDPQTALINRFYTLEFYQSARENLAENGILSFSITSSENVLSDEQTVFLQCLYHTMKRVFSDIVMIPGNAIHFIGCLSENVLSADPQIIIERLQQRNLPTVYMREYYIPFRMTPDRMDYVTEKIAQKNTQMINHDFRPIGYFYSILLWLTYFNIDLKLLLRLFDQFHPLLLLLIPLLIIIPFILWRSVTTKKQRVLRSAIVFAIMIIGFSEISLEVLIILGFQAIYGYAYYQLALIMSGFMIGLTLGSWYSLRQIKMRRVGLNNFMLFLFLMICYPLVTLGALTLLSKIVLPTLVIQIVFLLLIVSAGLIGGYQFPLANHLIFHGKQRIESVGGRLYAADLSGSVIGALITCTLLIPILGLGYTCVAFCLLNFGVILVLLCCKK